MIAVSDTTPIMIPSRFRMSVTRCISSGRKLSRDNICLVAGLMPVYDIFAKDARFRCTLQQELYRPEYWCEIMPAKATKAAPLYTITGIFVDNPCVTMDADESDLAVA